MVSVSKDVISTLNQNARQFASIECTKNGQTIVTITEADIIQGGLKIDRCCVSGDKIEIGSAIASELTLKLQNYDGRFNDISFEGSELYVKIGIRLKISESQSELSKLGHIILGSSRIGIISESSSDATKTNNVIWITCGRFIVDTPPRKLNTITISALDRMVKLDRTVKESELSFPVHVDALIQKICSVCSISLATNVSNLPNHAFSIGSLPFSNQQLTYRQLLQWCAQITGTCAFMDDDGNLNLKWYEQTEITITASERYSSDMLENDITITGFTCDADNDSVYLAGADGYTLDLSDCGLLTDSQSGVLSKLYKERGGFSYRPYSATIKPAPYLFPLDMIHFRDKFGIVHDTIVTNVTFGLNCNTSISGAGETLANSSYVQSNKGVTNQQTSSDRKTDDKINRVDKKTDNVSTDLSSFKTQYASDLKITNDAIESKVSKETYRTDISGITQRVSSAETVIKQNSEAIVLRATKDELDKAKTSAAEDATAKANSALESAEADATAKSNDALKSAKEYTNAQLKITNDAIESKVSKGDVASVINQTAQGVLIDADKIDLKGKVTTDSISSDGIDAKVIKVGTITADRLNVTGDIYVSGKQLKLSQNSVSASNIASGQIMKEVYSFPIGKTYSGGTVTIDDIGYTQLLFVFRGWYQSQKREQSSGSIMAGEGTVVSNIVEYSHYTATNTMVVPITTDRIWYQNMFNYPKAYYKESWEYYKSGSEDNKIDNTYKEGLYADKSLANIMRFFSVQKNGSRITISFKNAIEPSTDKFLWISWESSKSHPDCAIPWKIYGIK